MSFIIHPNICWDTVVQEDCEILVSQLECIFDDKGIRTFLKKKITSYSKDFNECVMGYGSPWCSHICMEQTKPQV